jgi:hypothetical protein
VAGKEWKTIQESRSLSGREHTLDTLEHLRSSTEPGRRVEPQQSSSCHLLALFTPPTMGTPNRKTIKVLSLKTRKKQRQTLPQSCLLSEPKDSRKQGPPSRRRRRDVQSVF